ncbi:MAG: hypothetical protein KFW07_00930 [Mycoplasmataceae bacterium]|nr:hypothetical protein [Mycoplasmataceae bacterium]
MSFLKLKFHPIVSFVLWSIEADKNIWFCFTSFGAGIYVTSVAIILLDNVSLS